MASPLDEEFDALPDAPPPAQAPAPKSLNDEFDAMPDAPEEPGLASRAWEATKQGAADLASLPVKNVETVGKALSGDFAGAAGDVARRGVSMLGGFSEAGTFGHRDELAGLMKTAGQRADKPFMGVFSEGGPGLVEQYYANRKGSEDLFKEAERQEPGAYLAGAGVAMVPGLAAKVPKLAGGLASKAWQAAKVGAPQGAAFGSGVSEAKPLESAGEAAKYALDTTIGGGMGGAGAAGLTAIGSTVLKPVTSWLSKKAEEWGVKAIVGNGHLNTQRALAERGISDDLVKFARSEGMLDVAATSQGRVEQAMAAQQKYGQQVGDILKWSDKQAAPLVNGNDLAAQIEAEVIAPLQNKPIWGGGGPTPAGAHAGHGMDMTPLGQLKDQVKRLRSLGDLSFEEANALKRSYDEFLNFDKQMTPLREKFKAIRGVINRDIENKLDSVAASIDPARVGEFQAAKRNYGLASEITDLANERVLQLKNNKNVGLTDWLSLIAAGNQGHGFTTMLAALAAKRVAERMGPAAGSNAAAALPGLAASASQSIAPRAAALGAAEAMSPRDWHQQLPMLLERSPGDFGKYAAPLVRAARQGPDALAAVDYALTKQDPEYQRIKFELTGGAR